MCFPQRKMFICVNMNPIISRMDSFFGTMDCFDVNVMVVVIMLLFLDMYALYTPSLELTRAHFTVVF